MIPLKDNNTLFLQVSPSSIFVYALSNSLLYTDNHIFSEINDLPSLVSEIVNKLPSELKDSISSSHILYNTLSSSFVPKDIFEEKDAKDLLSYNNLLEDEKDVLIDYLPEDQSMVNIYQAIFYGLDEALNLHFKKVSFEHYATMLWTKIDEYISRKLLPKSGHRIFIDTTNKNSFRLIVTKNDKLLIHNVFEYKDKETFAYYILYVFKVFEIDSEIVTVYEIKTFSNRQSEEVYQLRNYGIKTGIVDIAKYFYKEIEYTESTLRLILA